MPPACCKLNDALHAAAAAGAFPGAVLLAARHGRVYFHGAAGATACQGRHPATVGTVYDLASLTKPLATTPAVMVLVQDGRIGLDRPVAELLPDLAGRPAGAATTRQLLVHRAGLAAHRPYYFELADLPPETRLQEVRRRLAAEPLVHPPNSRTCYSDLGFMLLQWVVEAVGGEPLARFVTRRVYAPLGLDGLFFATDDDFPPLDAVAPTEICPWRGRMVHGEVHDENAAVLGGVAGQAGLFGTAAGVWGLVRVLIEAWHGRPVPGGVLSGATVRAMFAPQPDGDRALGFDRPAACGSSAGRFFSTGSVGHLGFTGTSFWLDLNRRAAVVLLSNRVHPTRRNDTIRTWRPRLHDAAMGCLGLGEGEVVAGAG